MNRVFFEEVQSAKDVRIVWVILIPFTFLLTLPFLYGIYWQIWMGEPWGSKPVSNAGLLIAAFATIGGLLFANWIIWKMKLETRIDNLGIHYRFFPNHLKWRTIARDDIDSLEVKKLKSLLETGGWGYQRSYFRNLRSMMIKGKTVLEVRLKSGLRIRLGTQDAVQMESGIKKLMEPR